MSKCSSWSRLRRVVAWVLRFKSNLLLRVRKREYTRKTVETTTIPLVAVSELREAEREIIKHVQRVTFSEEINVLTRKPGEASNSQVIKKSSSIYQLDPTVKNRIATCWWSHTTSPDQRRSETSLYSTKNPARC